MSLNNKPTAIQVPGRQYAIFTLVILLMLALGLTTSCIEADTTDQDTRLKIVATTNILGDMVSEIAGDAAQVTALMGPGVDPHLYKATQGDVQKLRRADLIIYNGLHLEGKMTDVLERMHESKKVINASDGLPRGQLRRLEGFRDSYDPHIWFDVRRWRQSAMYVSRQIQEADPDNASVYQANTHRYLAALDSLDAAVMELIATIPADQRVMVTAHDAFGYFGERYGIEVRGLQGISTLSEYGLQDVSQLAQFITQRRIKAMFVESSVPRRSIEAVQEGCRQRGHEVIIGGTLYSDALAEPGHEAGNYIGMVRYNTRMLVEALR
jgi:manganese/zinc/iron transport system substrate-binding protein